MSLYMYIMYRMEMLFQTNLLLNCKYSCHAHKNHKPDQGKYLPRASGNVNCQLKLSFLALLVKDQSSLCDTHLSIVRPSVLP